MLFMVIWNVLNIILVYFDLNLVYYMNNVYFIAKYTLGKNLFLLVSIIHMVDLATLFLTFYDELDAYLDAVLSFVDGAHSIEYVLSNTLSYPCHTHRLSCLFDVVGDSRYAGFNFDALGAGLDEFNNIRCASGNNINENEFDNEIRNTFECFFNQIFCCHGCSTHYCASAGMFIFVFVIFGMFVQYYLIMLYIMQELFCKYSVYHT